VPLTGQRDGKTFEVALVPGGLAHFFGGSISLSGIYSGTAISLNGQGNGFWANLNLVKGSAADYSNYVAGLNAQAQLTENMRMQQEQAREQQAAQQAAAQQEADAARDLESRITNDLTINATTSATVAARVQQLNLDVSKIRSVTAKMQDYLAKEAALGGYRSVQGAQISVAMNQANVELSNDMIGLQSHYSDIQQNGIPALLDKFKQHDVTCKGLNATSSTQASFTGPQPELSDCIEMEEATPELQQKVIQLDSAYQAVFSTWQTENAKQQAIIQQSEH